MNKNVKLTAIMDDQAGRKSACRQTMNFLGMA